MILFFSAARLVWLGHTWKTFEEGHAVLVREALARWSGDLPPGIDPDRMILGNQRMDMPRKRADGSIGPWGLALALWQAQTKRKYHHAMRQPWHHPTRGLPEVQDALNVRLLRAIRTPAPLQASEYLGAALHTLQDTYTRSHAQRADPADPCSPLCHLHYSPSKTHPLISPDDRVWLDEAETQLKPEAEAAIVATIDAFALFAAHWPQVTPQTEADVADFVARYVPISAPE